MEGQPAEDGQNSLKDAKGVVGLALRRPYTFIVMAMLIVLATPFVLLGSLALLLYTLFSWLENVALARALHHGRPELPRVPWGFAAVFVLAPLLLLALRMPAVALPLLIVTAAAPDCLLVDPWNALGTAQVFAYAAESAAMLGTAATA